MTRVKFNKKILIVLFIVLGSVSLVAFAWLSSYDENKSEACRKWEELRRQIELEESRQKGDSELQWGVSALQAEALRYQEVCQATSTRS